jgi:hypothetical protein
MPIASAGRGLEYTALRSTRDRAVTLLMGDGEAALRHGVEGREATT